MILVTGGTGLVGSHLLLALAQQGQLVRAIRRESSSLEAVKTVFNYHPDGENLFKKIDWFQANLLDVISLDQALQGITAIYHCAAYISFNPAKANLLRKVNIEGTANLVNAAVAAKVEKLCYVSSIASLGSTPDTTPITESTSWNPQNKNSGYAISKYGAELEVWRGAQEGLKAVILHPGVVLGEGHWNSASGMLIPKIAKGVKFYPKGMLGVVDVKDIVTAMLLVFSKPQAFGQNYILVGKNLTYKEFFSAVLTVNNKKRTPKPLSKTWLQLAAFLNYLTTTFFGSKRVLSQNLVDAMYQNKSYSANKIIVELELSFTPLEQTIKRISNTLNE